MHGTGEAVAGLLRGEHSVQWKEGDAMIQPSEISLIACGEQNQPGMLSFSTKNPDTDVFLLLCGGKSTIRVNDRQYYMQPFTFLIHPFEEGKVTIEPQGSACFRYLHLHLSAQYMKRVRERYLTTKEVHTLARPLAVEEIWKLLDEAQGAATESGKAIGAHALSLLLCLLWEASDGTVTRAAEVPHYDKLSSLRHRIYQHPEENWFIQDICEELGISRPYFHKIYLAAFGTTCTQDVIASRIACSKHLLETTDDPIAAVSQQSGFETDVYFMRQFKRHVGMTPTAYRRIYRQSMLNK